MDVPQRELIELDVLATLNTLNDFNSQVSKKKFIAMTETKSEQYTE